MEQGQTFAQRMKGTAARVKQYEQDTGVLKRVLRCVISFILLICSFAPIIKLDITTMFSWANKLNVTVSPFQIIESMFYTFAGSDYENQATAELLQVSEKIPTDIIAKISSGEELDRNDINRLNKVFNQSNMFKITVIMSTYKNVGNSLSVIFFGLMALAMMAVPLGFLAYSIYALVKKKDFKLHKLLIVNFILALTLIFSMGIGKQSTSVGGGMIASLTFLSLFSAIEIVLACVKNKKDFSVKRLIKSAVMCGLAIALLGLSYGDISTARFDKTQTTYKKDYYYVEITSGAFRDILNMEFLTSNTLTVEEVNALVKSIVEKNVLLDEKIPAISALIPSVLVNKDMRDIYPLAIAMMWLVPFFTMGIYGCMIAAFAATFSSLLKGAPSQKSRVGKGMFLSATILSAVLFVVMIIVTISFNGSADYIGLPMKLLINAVLIFILLLPIGGLIVDAVMKDKLAKAKAPLQNVAQTAEKAQPQGIGSLDSDVLSIIDNIIKQSKQAPLEQSPSPQSAEKPAVNSNDSESNKN